MVLVSHRHRFIYLKTKKTASTSVEAFFEPFCLDGTHDQIAEYRDEYIGPSGIVGARRGRAKRAAATWHAHMSAWDVFRHLGPRRWFGYFKFTTVRNPYEKTVSEFLYERRADRDMLAGPLPARRAAFESWLATKKLPTDRYVYAIAGRPVIQDAIRFENLGAELSRVARKLGLDPASTALPRFKSGGSAPKDPYAAYYSDHSRARVAAAYAPELSRFGYAFDDAEVPHGLG